LINFIVKTGIQDSVELFNGKLINLLVNKIRQLDVERSTIL